MRREIIVMEIIEEDIIFDDELLSKNIPKCFSFSLCECSFLVSDIVAFVALDTKYSCFLLYDTSFLEPDVSFEVVDILFDTRVDGWTVFTTFDVDAIVGMNSKGSRILLCDTSFLESDVSCEVVDILFDTGVDGWTVSTTFDMEALVGIDFKCSRILLFDTSVLVFDVSCEAVDILLDTGRGVCNVSITSDVVDIVACSVSAVEMNLVVSEDEVCVSRGSRVDLTKTRSLTSPSHL